MLSIFFRKQQHNESIIWIWTKNIFYFSLFFGSIPFILMTFAGESRLNLSYHPRFILFNLLSVVTLGHKLKLFLLTKRFSYLEFARSNTIRTLVDTSRNPGILHFLIKVKGDCDLDQIRNAYQEHLLDKRDRNGKFLYPRLRALLISCWGQYAFVKNFE